MMAENLNITVVQTDIIWEDENANLTALDRSLHHLPSKVDIVVLPEMFTTGFSMNAAQIATAWNEENPTLLWLQKKAHEYNTAITGSIAVKDGDHYYNRLLWVEPNGNFTSYDKRHTFSFAGEDKVYARGNNRLIVNWRGWRICPLICYDLRFPVWSRNTNHQGQCEYDVLIYVANWPAVRRFPWQQLLVARSIENLSYVVGCNRIGVDDNTHLYCGDSAIINFLGQNLTEPSENLNALLSASCSYSDLQAFRDKFPALSDGDPFQIL
jgi:omega-amidase